MSINPNPYVWNEVNPELCYGREDILSDMLSYLPGTPRFSFGLAGGRRMGKSTVLRRIENDLKIGDLQVVPIYIDGLALPYPLTASQLWGHIACEIARNLPETSFEAKKSLDFSSFKELLKPVLTELPEYRRIVILFDEIEKITACDWSFGFWSHWRALLSNTPGLQEYFTVVFAGGRELTNLRRDVGSPLADILEWRNLHCLKFEDARKLMQQPIDREWSTSFLELIYKETGGHPFLLQYIMQYVCRTISNDSDELELIRQAVNKFRKERDWQFNEWWQQYCTKMAHQIYNELPDNGSTLPKRTLTIKFDLVETNKALENLQHVGLVAAEDDGFAYRYTGEMFRRWYRDNYHANETNEILTLISNGEGATLEFKSSMRWDYRQKKLNKRLDRVIAKTIAGFLNVKGGGKLLIGVDDKGTVVGLTKDYQTLGKKDSDGFELSITNIISRYIGKEFCLYIRTSFHIIDNKDVCLITVEHSKSPAYVKDGNDTKFYIRTGGSTQPLDTEKIAEYVTDHFQ